jgi:hypothetical protein
LHNFIEPRVRQSARASCSLFHNSSAGGEAFAVALLTCRSTQAIYRGAPTMLRRMSTVSHDNFAGVFPAFRHPSSRPRFPRFAFKPKAIKGFILPTRHAARQTPRLPDYSRNVPVCCDATRALAGLAAIKVHNMVGPSLRSTFSNITPAAFNLRNGNVRSLRSAIARFSKSLGRVPWKPTCSFKVMTQKHITEKEGSGEILCPRCRAEANWRFLDEDKTLVEVFCSDCGAFELSRVEFEKAESDVFELNEAH